MFLETSLYVHSHGHPDLIRTDALPGWDAARLQKEHTAAFINRLNQRRRECLDARHDDIVTTAEVQYWGPPEGWPEREGMAEYRKSQYLTREAARYAECVKAINSLRTYQAKPLLRPFPKATYRDRSEEIAAKYDGVTFERTEPTTA